MAVKSTLFGGLVGVFILVWNSLNCSQLQSNMKDRIVVTILNFIISILSVTRIGKPFIPLAGPIQKAKWVNLFFSLDLCTFAVKAKPIDSILRS